jgi:hypothetical protein
MELRHCPWELKHCPRELRLLSLELRLWSQKPRLRTLELRLQPQNSGFRSWNSGCCPRIQALVLRTQPLAPRTQALTLETQAPSPELRFQSQNSDTALGSPTGACPVPHGPQYLCLRPGQDCPDGPPVLPEESAALWDPSFGTGSSVTAPSRTIAHTHSQTACWEM